MFATSTHLSRMERQGDKETRRQGDKETRRRMEDGGWRMEDGQAPVRSSIFDPRSAIRDPRSAIVTLSPCHPVTLSCCFLVCFVLGCTVIAGAEPPAAPVKAAENAPPPAVEQAKIDKAIHDGAWYLANNQLPYGMWTDGKGGTAIGHDVAYAALPGLTMLECGVPPTYEGVQRAAQFVRLRSPNLAQTYDLALAVLFLDKLGDPRDKELIEVLTMRLVAGQTTNGGWSYRCPILLPGEHRELLTALQVLTPPIPAPPPPVHPAADAARLATTVNSQAGVPRPPTLQIDRNPQNSNNLLPAQQPAGTPSPVPVPAPVVAPPLTMGQAQPAADAARLATSVNPPQPIIPVISEAERRRQAEFLFATRVLPNLSDKVKRMAVLGDVVPIAPADPAQQEWNAKRDVGQFQHPVCLDGRLGGPAERRAGGQKLAAHLSAFSQQSECQRKLEL